MIPTILVLRHPHAFILSSLRFYSYKLETNDCKGTPQAPNNAAKMHSVCTNFNGRIKGLVKDLFSFPASWTSPCLRLPTRSCEEDSKDRSSETSFPDASVSRPGSLVARTARCSTGDREWRMFLVFELWHAFPSAFASWICNLFDGVFLPSVGLKSSSQNHRSRFWASKYSQIYTGRVFCFSSAIYVNSFCAILYF